MRTRATTLFLACAVFVSLVAVAPAQAACRPTTLADLFPSVPETPIPDTTAPPVSTPPAPLIAALAPATTTTTVSVPTTVPTTTTMTTVSVPTTVPTATTTTTVSTATTVDPNAVPPATTSTVADPNTSTTTTAAVDPNAVSATTTPVPARPPVARCSYVYRMQWPVLGGGAVLSTFGADRDGGARHHAGVDISAAKMTPVVAVRDGTIRTLHAHGADCCAIGIAHDDGWSSYYLHLNNDVDGSDNGHGVGIRPDLVIGTRVVAGEVIGWVGDSGNAEPSTPHLHFELHMRSGVAIDPLASLRWAFRRMPAPALEFGPASFSGPYYDDDGLPAEATFRLLASLGVVRSCDAWNAAVCPDSEASILDAVDWISALSRVLIPIAGPQTSTEIVDQIIAARTCPAEGCPPPPITVGTAASILIWVEEQRAHEDALAALEQAMDTDPELISSVAVPPHPEPYWFTDQTAAASRLTGRGMADNCPIATPAFNQVLTRAQLAEMIGKALGYLPIVTCGAVA